MTSQQSVIDRIDKCMGNYFQNKGIETYFPNNDASQNGMFKTWCDDNGFEDNDIYIEMKQPASECALIEFAGDEYEEFPFDNDDIDTPQKQELIYKQLNCCYEPFGHQKIERTKDYPLPTDLNLNVDIETRDKSIKIYEKHVYECLGKLGIKEKDLMYFLAVQFINQGTPFLKYMVDCYSRDKIQHNLLHGGKKSLEVAEWTKHNPFCKQLTKKNKILANKLKTAMISYCHRIAPKFQFTPLVKIDDSMQIICEYLMGTTIFIQSMMKNYMVTPPFHVDLVFAFRGVIDNKSDIKPELPPDEDDTYDGGDEKEDSDDDTADEIVEEKDEYDNDNDDDINFDYIGNVREKLKETNCTNLEQIIPDDINLKTLSDECNDLGGDQRRVPRFMGKMYKKFRSLVVSNTSKRRKKRKQSNPENDDNDDGDDDNERDEGDEGDEENDNEGTPAVVNTKNDDIDDNDDNEDAENPNKSDEKKQSESHRNWPSRSRFCIFVDRRDQKQTKMTFYQPPDTCNTMPPAKEFVNEWHHEAVRKVIIPRKEYGDGTKEYLVRKTAKELDPKERSKIITINSHEACNGQIATFSFHVQQSDEIQCYLFWNKQTLRFYPQDIIEVFPYIFVDAVNWRPPKAMLTTKNSTYEIGEEIIFDASKSESYGKNNKIVQYDFFIDGEWEKTKENKITHKYTTSGEKDIKLSVCDKNEKWTPIEYSMKVKIIEKHTKSSNDEDKKEEEEYSIPLIFDNKRFSNSPEAKILAKQMIINDFQFEDWYTNVSRINDFPKYAD